MPALVRFLTVAAGGVLLAAAVCAQPAPPTTAPTAEVVYADPTAASSANVTQVLPNAGPSMLTFTGVESVALRQEVFVIHWGQGAVTLLPRQFVSSITINRRQGPATSATGPGTRRPDADR